MLPLFSSIAELIRIVRARLRVRGGEAFLVVAGHLLAVLGNFAGLKLLTHLLAPEAYGELSLGMTAAGVIFSLGYAPLLSASMRFYPIYAGKSELPVHVLAFRRAAVRLTLSVFALAIVSAAIIAVTTQPRWGFLVVGGALYAAGNGIALLHTSYSTAIRQRGSLFLYQAIDSWLRPVCALAALLIFGRTGAIALAGYVLAGSFNAIVQAARARGTPAMREKPPAAIRSDSLQTLLRETLAYALPLAVTALFSSVSSYGDRWTLQGLLGPADLGIYAALCQIGMVPSSLILGLASAIIYPICFERAGDLTSRAQIHAATEILVWAIGLCALFAIPIIGICALFGPQLMTLLTARGYAVNASQLWIVALAGFALAIGRTSLLTVEILRETKQLLLPWVANAVVTVVLSIALGMRWGIRGIIAALLFSNLCGALVSIWISVRLVRRRLAALPS